MRKKSMDYALLIATVILVAFGILMVFSASYYYAETKFSDGLYFFKKQILGAVVGFVAMIVLSFFDYKKLKKFRYIGLIIAIGLLAVVLVKGVGVNLNGSSRWLSIAGFSVQPSEIAKFALILFFAANMADKKDKMQTFKYGIFPYLLVLGIVCGLLYLQPNFSAIVCIALMGFVMMWVGGAKRLHLSLIAGAGAVGGTALMMAKSYRMDRIFAFLNPWQYASDEGYQLIQSLYAIGASGLFGCGIGNSRQKFLYLPYGESDFIFSIITEEIGFIGAIALILVFVFLIWRGIKIALKAPDLFGTLLATGIVSIIGIQVLVHIAVVTGSIPPTGVTLPFISAGNSSLMIFMASIGILLNISRQCEKG
ncbi:MAG: putative lipid II flippase FtsW [Eubacteriales bacterium]